MSHSQHTTAVSMNESAPATLTQPAGTQANGSFGRSSGLRRNSWLSNLHNKFGSSTTQVPTPPPAPTLAQVPEKGVLEEKPTAPIPATKETPAESKASSGYIISKLRRLSSSSQAAPSRSAAKGQPVVQEQCPRMILNKNFNRKKCHLEDLDGMGYAMKRVAFSLDVQFAPPSIYVDDESPDEESDSAPTSASPHAKARPADNGQITRNEVSKPSTDSRGPVSEDEVERKRLDKIERKERKDSNKYKQVDLTGNAKDNVNALPTPTNKVDPEPKKPASSRKESSECYKKYKRCCHLRELPVNPGISQQLKKQRVPIISLDLSAQHLALTDIVALCDFLALTALRSLILDDCNLTDEGLRIILASLLPVKKPCRIHKHDPENLEGHALREPSLETLSIRNNDHIGKNGWRYLCYFVRMSPSLRSLDISGNKLPLTATCMKAEDPRTQRADVGDLFANVIGTRSPRSNLDELNVGHCDFTASQLSKMLVGTTHSCIKKISIAGIAESNLSPALWESIGLWLQAGGIALGLSDSNLDHALPTLLRFVPARSPLVVLELKNCGLTSSSMSLLLSSLARLANFRMLNLSDNPLLFRLPSTVATFRQELPKLTFLKRLYLENVSLTPNHVIALAEIFAEAPRLAYISLLRNSLNEAHEIQADEEARTAMFTALVACARVSKSIVAIELEVPGVASTIFVKSLARRLVGFCLRNMELGAEVSWDDELLFRSGNEEVASVKQIASSERMPIAPAGDAEEEEYDHGEEDFVADGSGVVKALDVCLETLPTQDAEFCQYNHSQMTSPEKAREVSKNLLLRARKIREKVIVALASDPVDENHYKRMLFLNETLDRTIERFEQEYPECRLLHQREKACDITASDGERFYENNDSDPEDQTAADEEETTHQTLRLSRRSSEVDMAARALESEEGHMHKFGQYITRQFHSDDPDHVKLKSEIIDQHIAELKHDTDGLEDHSARRRIIDNGNRKLVDRMSIAGLDSVSSLEHIDIEDQTKEPAL